MGYLLIISTFLSQLTLACAYVIKSSVFFFPFLICCCCCCFSEGGDDLYYLLLLMTYIITYWLWVQGLLVVSLLVEVETECFMILIFSHDWIWQRTNTWKKMSKLPWITFMRSSLSLRIWWKQRCYIIATCATFSHILHMFTHFFNTSSGCKIIQENNFVNWSPFFCFISSLHLPIISK